MTDRQPPTPAALPVPPPSDEGPKGIGGWLILPLIGLVLTILVGIFNLALLLPPSAEYVRLLVSEQMNSEYMDVAVVTLLETALYVAFLIYTAFCLGAFVSKLRRTPKLMIALYATAIGISLYDVIATAVIANHLETASVPLGFSTLPMRIILCLGWMAYFGGSERVKNTFVN